MGEGLDRRMMLAGGGAMVGALLLPGCTTMGAAVTAANDPLAPYRTPHKIGRLVLAGTGRAGDFDEKAVDCPFVFTHDGRFYLTYVGFDGTGYQTGIAVSDDLVEWQRLGVILARDPADPVTRYNIATASILRDNDLQSPGRLIRVDGRYVCAWHAYPSPGYEEGPAVIGLAFSDDLMSWERGPPILRAEDGAEWERGGLYKPYLSKIGDTYHLYYNAKTADRRWVEQTGLATSPDLVTWTRHPASPLLRNGVAGRSYDDRFASDPVVLRHGDEWAMFYFGLSSDGKARDLLAIGTSPTDFAKVGEVLVDAGPPGTVDEKYAHKPAIVYHDGALYHFYCAVSGDWPNDVRGISVARSTPW
ncbi:hypothetical protein V5740_14425 (plasmid) [Croceibacterium sp. TMG7-5b_MA50]|uniref:hypothetical protein n=1 Tax=Croceibacterium sp. TMG7-5b_MA50 TaxID=3121290 RepID=UPI0032214E61